MRELLCPLVKVEGMVDLANKTPMGLGSQMQIVAGVWRAELTCDEQGSLLRQSGEQCGRRGTGGRRLGGRGFLGSLPEIWFRFPPQLIEEGHFYGWLRIKKRCVRYILNR